MDSCRPIQGFEVFFLKTAIQRLPKAFRSSTRGRTEMVNLSKKTLIPEKTFTSEIMQMLIGSRENEVSDFEIRDSFPHILHGRL